MQDGAAMREFFSRLCSNLWFSNVLTVKADQQKEREVRLMRSIEETIRLHGDMVYRLAVAYLRSVSEAEDVFQEVFLRLVQHDPQFESDEHEKAWLIRVTINCARSTWRQWIRRKNAQAAQEAFTPAQTPEESEVDEAIATLPARYRAVIYLHYYEGYTTDEIARMLHQRASTIRTQMTRARRMLGELLKGDEDHVS